MGDAARPWWKAKEISLQRKRAAAVRPAFAQSGDSFLIVTEGEVTEPVYFEFLRDSLQLSTVTVKVIPGKASDPRHVVQTASEEVKALERRMKRKDAAMNEVGRYDHVWAVIDTDVATRNSIWNDVVQKARDLKVNLAQSTPCFEFWLLLHVKMTTRGDLLDGDTAKKVFRFEFGSEYSTNREVTEKALASLLPKWPEAVRHARQVREHHHEANTQPPANPSTDVDKLVCALNDSAHPHMRKIPCRDS